MPECSEEHKQINAKLDDLSRLLEFHTAEVHSDLVDRETIVSWDRKTAAQVDKLATAVMGPMVDDFDGPHRVDEDGLMAKVDRNAATLVKHGEILASIDRQVHNGLKMTLQPAQKTQITIAALSSFTAVVVAIIALFG